MAWQNRQSGWIGRSKFGLRGELPVAGRDIPAPLLREPRDRRLEEETVALDQEGDAARPGAESEPDFGLDLGKQAPVRVAPRRLVEHASVAVLDRVLHPLSLDRESRSGAGRRAVLGACDRRERSAHRVRAVGLGDLAVAPGTGRVPDIRDPRARVLVRRAGVHVAHADGRLAESSAGGPHDRPQRRPDGPDDPGEEQRQMLAAAPRKTARRGEGGGLGSFTAHSRQFGRFALRLYDVGGIPTLA